MMKYCRAALFSVLVIFSSALLAQQPDSSRALKDTSLFVTGTVVDTIAKPGDTLVKKRHSPRKAAIRSAIIPGWGQAYNKKYWKIPLVYGALSIPAYLFVDNLKWYRRSKYAFLLVATNSTNVDSLNRVHPQLRPFVDRRLGNELQNYRNEFRRNVDYSALFFLLFWGLNIIDATVDAHLKEFDVSPDLTFKIKPGFSEVGKTYGLSLVLKRK